MLTMMILLLADFIAACGAASYGWITGPQVFDFWQTCMIIALITFCGACVLSVLGSGAAAGKKLLYVVLVILLMWVYFSCGVELPGVHILTIPITWIGYAVNVLISLYEGIKEG